MDLGDPTNQMALAPIIPYAILGGIALLWMLKKLPESFRHRLRQTVYAQALIVAIAIPLSFNFWISRLDRTFFYSQADFSAMQWLMENAPDSRVLNHHRDRWFMPATGIDSFSVELPIGILTYRGRITERTPSSFWGTDNLKVLTSYDVNYIFTPHWRIDDGLYRLSDMPFLEIVFEQDGAIVYQVVPQEN
jgi:hypothetical protein